MYTPTGNLDADVQHYLTTVAAHQTDTYLYAMLVRRYGRKAVQAAIQRRERDQ